ncbi:exonuclease domain-containing protein [Algoriphagus marincola]|uniref:exonuclease domain-containing protein n=1 Tax=Algoriphagus marincola TaxID=264027 RepID=UPI0004209447|nr:exonuclease domain-containing protein [Algoriphagus marincola]
MENHFFVIDLETANLDNSSICQIGLAEFDGPDLISSWDSLIDPKQFFDPYLSRIHGITSDLIDGSPSFQEVSKELAEKVNGRRLFHHMPFDRNAINRACERYQLPFWNPIWMDSAKVVRRAWPEFANSGYALGKITTHLGISFQAHDALQDALATGQVIQKALHHSNVSLKDWETRIYAPIHQKDFTGKERSYKKEGNPNGILYGESVVFTGTLSQSRSIYAEIAAEAGCRVQDGVNKETTLLVVGLQDSYRLAGYEKSSKHRKAEDLSQRGFPIKILSENDFLALIQLNND